LYQFSFKSQLPIKIELMEEHLERKKFYIRYNPFLYCSYCIYNALVVQLVCYKGSENKVIQRFLRWGRIMVWFIK